ncbi:MAG: alpha/beta hydrolase [Gammaproteobacteria bacterium]
MVNQAGHQPEEVVFRKSALEQRRVPSDRDHEAERTLVARFWKSADPTNPRASYDTFIGMTPAAAGIAFEEVVANDIRGWWCRPSGAVPDRMILYLHGGAYVMGSAAAYRGFASQIERRTGLATFVLDYPLAPEHPAPVALENDREQRWSRPTGCLGRLTSRFPIERRRAGKQSACSR